MKGPGFRLPTAAAVGEEVALRIIAALVAAYLIGQVPPVRNWIRRQWQGPG